MSFESEKTYKAAHMQWIRTCQDLKQEKNAKRQLLLSQLAEIHAKLGELDIRYKAPPRPLKEDFITFDPDES